MAVNLSPVGGVAAQFFDNSGQVLTGGKLYTYLAGTTTPAATYTTNSGLTANSNPIVLNAAGRVADSGEIWLTDGINYKFVLKDSNDVQIAVWDNISGINSNFVNYTLQEQTFTATQGQTVFTLTGGLQYTPATNNLSVFVNGSKQVAGTNYLETSTTVFTFLTGLNVGDVVDAITAIPVATNVISSVNVSYNQGGTGAVTTNVQAKLQQTVSVKDFGAVGNGSTDDTAAIQNAIDYVYDNGLGKLYFPAGNYKITKSLMVWGNQTATYNGKGISLIGADSTNTIITKTTNTGYGGVSPYASDDAIFVLARRDLTAGNSVALLSIHIANFNLNGDFGTGKVAFGIYNRCSTGACTFDSLVIQAAIGFQTLTDLYLSRITNTSFIVSTKGFSMLAAGTSNYLCNVAVFNATSIAYELRGTYSSANSIASDNCTGTCYNFNFGNWVVNGLGSESTSATTVISASNSDVIINNPNIFPNSSAGAKVFDISSNIIIVNGGYIGNGAGTPQSNSGQLANVSAAGTFQLNNCQVIDTYAVANSGRFTRSPGAGKSGTVSVPNATATTLYSLANGEEVGIFIAYATGSNANIYSTAYVGIAGGNSGLAVLSSNALTLTNVSGVIKATHALGSTTTIGWKYLTFGEAFLP